MFIFGVFSIIVGVLIGIVGLVFRTVDPPPTEEPNLTEQGNAVANISSYICITSAILLLIHGFLSVFH